MSRIEQVFMGGKAFIPFITAGDPNLKFTQKLIKEMAEAGADLIEIGIPFSDPIAEGPVIQEASNRALMGGVTVDKIFEMVKELRKECSIPLAFMTYANPVFSYGSERFIKKCKEYGIDGLIIPDVPFEEQDEFRPFCEKYGVNLISLIAPTSGERIQKIVKESQGFIYCVSSMGVTGMRKEFSNHIENMIKEVKKVKDIPCAIGFGISSPEQARQMAEISDGVIVGSAIVNIIAEYGKDSIPHVREFVKKMKEAIV
ncbi:tryptophan synthase subunit alpha [Herbinix luporum]|jgi:tryptophan synthase alpha chain|uniref:Tryptophan synthase alpha chain n=1 Tax=Herbinix luporum TaxID=1679721 RepID=A0A0K8J689_9FIRM|nr:tryptophan synthase subunit alpha [Herbinix luporum]MDI9488173.1 tryptophan synthase subunit alpha [Bacillota bacterium]CUH93151.1 Tryptophan synthase alpha chain [Herbinix luporum]HHT57995.1 tryptophan synthase subunit alpha [Herbinix luporum]